jgi:diguanylate cyclase (GGDEF)-like protein
MLETLALRNSTNLYVRILIALGGFGIYVVVFPLLYTMAGASTAALTVIPMALIGWLLRVRGSLFFGVLSHLLNGYLFEFVGDPGAGAVIPSLVNSFAVTLIGMTIGWTHDLLDRVNNQAAELHEERRSLQEEMGKRMEMEERLTHEALHDPLTNLANRRLFLNRLEHALEWNKRHPDDLFAVVYLDFDRFKVINDSLGHNTGDLLLVAVARHLKASVRAMDTVARMGGDEFAILVEAVNSNDEILAVVERLRESLTAPFEVRGNKATMTASIGVVLNLLQYARPEDILRDADIAMYSAKAAGRNRYKVFDMAMREQAEDVLILESGLRNAIQNSEFRLHYQPILSLSTQKITGFEALLRWDHPRRGLLYPGEFLKVAEESGLIIPIGVWVIYEACRQMKQWQTEFHTEPPLTISVNLSSRQFSQPDLIVQIEAVLEKTGLSASSLLVELTETTMVEDIEQAVTKIDQLHKLGVGIEIDDFGTGYSSLGYLRHLPVNSLKMDRSFTNSLDVGKNGIPIIRAIIAMAGSLGLKVVAEGIETAEQAARLTELKCDYGQGYYFKTPIDGDAAEKLIRETFGKQAVWG